MAITLGKEQITRCFDALNQKLAEHGQYGEILVCGGASMALLFDDTTVTKDIDAVILSTEMKNDISRYAAQIGEEQSLDEDWFNEAAKGYINLTWDREEVSKYSNLAVYSVPAEQLLAMKLSAARMDARDMEDAIKLMEHLGLQHEDEALEILEKNMPEIILTAKNEFFTREAFAEYKEREKAVEKQRLFIDMDGTLAVFTPVDELETLYEQGYFLNQAPHENVVAAVRELIENHPEIEVHILSAYLADSQYALAEKNAWLDHYLPEMDETHRIFVPCGSDKKEGIPGGVRENDFLLDDYTQNLNDWQPPARGIKLLNAINHTRGSWKHDRIRYDREPINLAESILSVIKGEKEIYDEKTETIHHSIDRADPVLTKLVADYEADLVRKWVEEHDGGEFYPPSELLVRYDGPNDEWTIKWNVTEEQFTERVNAAVKALGFENYEDFEDYQREYGNEQYAQISQQMNPERQEEGKIEYVVYIKAGDVKHETARFSTMEEAEKFCEASNWEYRDENEFVWDMDIEEHEPEEVESEALITIGGQECIKVEEWQIENDHYVLGRAIQQQEAGDFHYAMVNNDLTNIFEYEEKPTRQKVEDDYIDREAMRDIDRYEAEFGADGYRMFPSLQKEKETLVVKQDFAGMPAEFMAAYEQLYHIPEEQCNIAYSEFGDPVLKDGVTRSQAAEEYGRALRTIGYSAKEIEYIYVDKYYTGERGNLSEMVYDMLMHQMADGKPTAYITPGTSRNAFIKTMDEESRRSIEMAIRLAEIQEGYSGTELEGRIEEAMSNRLSAIDESLHVEERLDLAGQSIVTIENGGCTYVVLAEAVSEYGNTDLLLMRGSDRHFLIAKGWDEQRKTWDHDQYFGWDREALADAASEFAGHAYVRRCFAQSSLQEQFKTILEAEFPETVGNDTLQEDLYENFMESNQEGLFNNDLRREIVREIETQRQVEIEWETEYE